MDKVNGPREKKVNLVEEVAPDCEGYSITSSETATFLPVLSLLAYLFHNLQCAIVVDGKEALRSTGKWAGLTGEFMIFPPS